MLTFTHVGNIGDIIASLPCVIATCEERNETCKFVLEYNHPAHYSGKHPLGNVQLNKEWAMKLAPLLLTVPCIKVVDYKECNGDCYRREDATCYNLNQMTRLNINLAAGDLRRWYFQVWPIDWLSSRTWLDVEPDETFKGCILVNNTTRYRNRNINYHFMQHCSRPVVFVGLAAEYTTFRGSVPLAEHYEGKDFLALARAIRGSHCFVGNQSSSWWLAEAMGHPRLLEVYGQAPNCIPMTPNGYDAHHGPQFEEILARLTK